MESMLGETRSVGCMVEFGHLYFISLYRGGCILQLGESSGTKSRSIFFIKISRHLQEGVAPHYADISGLPDDVS